LPLVKILFRLKGFGKENLPRRGGFILATNHVSYLDPPLLGYACPRALYYMGKRDLFQNRWFALLLRNVNVFPVRPDEADMESLREAIRRLRQGDGLVILPEGTRSLDGTLGKAKPGVGFLSTLAKVPIIPGFVKGTLKAMPRGTNRIKPYPVKIYFGKPIAPHSGRGKKNYQKIADEVLKRIADLQRKYGN
jgi:1-acyl-sn-glycerol-3-phosphate acyltransferase